MIVFGEAHLRRILRGYAAYYGGYAAYYNVSRTHRSLNKDAPLHRAIERLGAVVSRPVLGAFTINIAESNFRHTHRAFRQYDAADPANRLVASELEARWNRALAHAAEVESKIAKHDAATAAPIADPASLGVLASNLKTVRDAPTTDARLKKRIVRTLVHEIVADIDDAASEIVLIVHWVSGARSELRLPKRRRGQRNSTSADIIQAVRQLVLIASDDLIAGLLNRNGLKTGNGNRWTRERVTSLRFYHHIPVFKPADDGIDPGSTLATPPSS